MILHSITSKASASISAKSKGTVSSGTTNNKNTGSSTANIQSGLKNSGLQTTEVTSSSNEEKTTFGNPSTASPNYAAIGGGIGGGIVGFILICLACIYQKRIKNFVAGRGLKAEMPNQTLNYRMMPRIMTPATRKQHEI